MESVQSITRPAINSVVYNFKTLYGILCCLLPRSVRSRIDILASITRQVLHLLVGRLLPDLNERLPRVNLRGQNAIVTGANSGIGLQIALELARRGANVVLACRSESRGRSALRHIVWNVPDATGRVAVFKLDTSSLGSVRQFAIDWVERHGRSDSSLGERKVDILVHNAGISHAPPAKELTDDGIEMLYATNFLGSFLLTYLLEPYLSAEARVVFTSSAGQWAAWFSPDFALGPVRGLCEPGFHVASIKVPFLGWETWSRAGSARYAMTKAMQCVMARCLQNRWDAQASDQERMSSREGTKAAARRTGRTAHAFAPGFMSTSLFAKCETTSWLHGLLRDPFFMVLKISTALATDVEQGAATGVWLACTDALRVKNGGGGYWDRMRREFSVADNIREEMLARFWTRWERDAGIS